MKQIKQSLKDFVIKVLTKKITIKKKDINTSLIQGILKEKTIIGPELVQLDITNNCNNSCIGCWIHSPLIKTKNENKFKFIPTKNIIETITQLKKLKTKTILLSGGGEPFTHPDINIIIKHIRKLEMQEIIITNFNLITKNDIKNIVKLGVTELLISIWAATSETYVKTHPNQTEKSFERLKANLEYLMKLIGKKKVPKVRLLNVLTNKNHHELNQMIKFGEKLGVHEIEFTLIDTIKGKTDNLLLNKEQQQELQKQINEFKSNKHTRVFGLERFKTRLKEEKTSKGYYDQKLVDSIPCYAGYSYARIMADGRVIPCCKAAKHPLGNINKKSFKEIWFSKKYDEFRIKAKNLKKSNPYFKKINCYKGCDNYIENLRIHKMISDYNENKK
ncbi:MAG: radical SAM protein [Nanoarchaeota archaeon]|nr:radical SAM protein [Nanoarchaeota archaeon]MBU1031125.1 radical SAM protein [Nanoarchaeota archaeon]MBU1850620.1 radical SAM protein [Nanoarchaeota archaeon]